MSYSPGENGSVSFVSMPRNAGWPSGAYVRDERIERGAVAQVLVCGGRRVLDADLVHLADLSGKQRSDAPRRQAEVIDERTEEVEAHWLAAEHVVQAPKRLDATALRDSATSDGEDLWGEEVQPGGTSGVVEHVAVVRLARRRRAGSARHSEHVGPVPALVQPHPGGERRITPVLRPDHFPILHHPL